MNREDQGKIWKEDSEEMNGACICRHGYQFYRERKSKNHDEKPFRRSY